MQNTRAMVEQNLDSVIDNVVDMLAALGPVQQRSVLDSVDQRLSQSYVTRIKQAEEDLEMAKQMSTDFRYGDGPRPEMGKPGLGITKETY